MTDNLDAAERPITVDGLLQPILHALRAKAAGRDDAAAILTHVVVLKMAATLAIEDAQLVTGTLHDGRIRPRALSTLPASTWHDLVQRVQQPMLAWQRAMAADTSVEPPLPDLSLAVLDWAQDHGLPTVPSSAGASLHAYHRAMRDKLRVVDGPLPPDDIGTTSHARRELESLARAIAPPTPRPKATVVIEKGQDVRRVMRQHFREQQQLTKHAERTERLIAALEKRATAIEEEPLTSGTAGSLKAAVRAVVSPQHVEAARVWIGRNIDKFHDLRTLGPGGTEVWDVVSLKARLQHLGRPYFD
jgi:hypothetical protein